MSNGWTNEMIGPQGQLRVVPSLLYNLQKFIGSSLKICSFRKKCPNLFLYHRERSIPLDALVIRYHHQNTGHKTQTEDKVSNGQTEEMIGQKQQMSAFLIIIQFTKFYSLLLWKFVHFHSGVLEGFLHMVFLELLRLSDSLANRPFCRSDISRVN